MRLSTKIFMILAFVCAVPAFALGRFLLEVFVPTANGFELHWTPISYISLVFQILFTIFSGILFVRFLKVQKLSTSIFFSIAPTSVVYALFVVYIMSVQDFDDATSNSVKHALRLSSTDWQHNDLLWIALSTIVYLLIVFLTVLILCKPLKKVEIISQKLGDGRMKFDDFKVGGGKQFQNIEFSLNKINYNYKLKENQIRKINLGVNKKVSKEFLKFIGQDNISILEMGNEVKKSASVVYVLLKKKNEKILNMEENYKDINWCLKQFAPVIKKFDGFIDKYLGGGFLAVFSSAQNAVEFSSALAKMTISKKYLMFFSNLEVKIVADTKDVVFGIVGDDEQKNPTIISNVLDDMLKMQDENINLGTMILISKNLLNKLPQNYVFDCRYVGLLHFDNGKTLACYENLESYKKRQKNKLKKLCRMFEDGVRMFDLGNFEQAKTFFEEVLKVMPDDKISYTFFNRCVDKIKEIS